MTRSATIRAPLTLAAALLALALARLPAHGQEAVRGHVLDDESGEPVPEATVTVLLGARRLASAIADAEGAFFLPLPTQGNYRLEVVRIGYRRSASQEFFVEQGDTVSVEFRVLRDAVLLRPILVTAHTSRGQNRFAARMEDWDRGIFITPAMVDSIQPLHPADVLRNQDKIFMTWDFARGADGRAGVIPRVRTFLGQGCMAYMVNNLPIRKPTWDSSPDWLTYPLDGLLGDDIVAVEVYRYVGEVPPELRRFADDHPNDPMSMRMCGLVNFWTREGW